MNAAANTTPAWESSFVDYNGFRIGLKRDFGSSPHRIDAMPCMWGYVVTYGPGVEYAGCNAMPGATWFQTVQEARDAIDIFIAIDGRANPGLFWSAWATRRRVLREARESFFAILRGADGPRLTEADPSQYGQGSDTIPNPTERG